MSARRRRGPAAAGLASEGWTFDTRADVSTRCPHPAEAVAIVGNVDMLKIWRCGRCGNQLVPVPPGWAWNRRKQRHERPELDQARRDLGHAYEYMATA